MCAASALETTTSAGTVDPSRSRTPEVRQPTGPGTSFTTISATSEPVRITAPHSSARWASASASRCRPPRTYQAP